MRIGRNDPCWCGSGKKYKRCHLDRHRQRPLPVGFFLRHMRAEHDRQMCLHPEAPAACTHGARAHAIQREGTLRRIARAGKVYSFYPCDPTRLRREGGLRERLVGIKDASVFRGFCAHHDATTFAPIDRSNFELTPVTAFLLGYRAFCRDYYVRHIDAGSVGYLRELDRGHPIGRQVELQAELAARGRSARAGLRDIEFHKQQLDAVLTARDYGRVRYYAVEFERSPDVVAAATWCPAADFLDRPLQDLRNRGRRMELLSFCVLARESGGIALFMWLDEQKACEAAVASLDELADDEVPNALVRLCTRLELVYLRPEWWEGLPEARRLAYRARLDTRIDPARGPLRALAPDGVRYCDWGRVRRVLRSDAGSTR